MSGGLNGGTALLALAAATATAAALAVLMRAVTG